ncbi:conserved hypothetical protein [Acetobacter orientalis]|uniref:Uncharacterized protein n=1 Tax=Acetobacter orientalis TaxID=146474 RepID=A0A2Z5ZD66_9PROT|nr:conserved hypothetical protein [Acetobacter orientalis]
MCGLFINNSYAEILPHACFVWVCGHLMSLLITKKQSIFSAFSNGFFFKS